MEIIFQIPGIKNDRLARIFNFRSWPAQSELENMGFRLFVISKNELRTGPEQDFAAADKRIIVEVQTPTVLNSSDKERVVSLTRTMTENMFFPSSEFTSVVYKFSLVDTMYLE